MILSVLGFFVVIFLLATITVGIAWMGFVRQSSEAERVRRDEEGGSVTIGQDQMAQPAGDGMEEDSPLFRSERLSTMNFWQNILSRFDVAEILKLRIAQAQLDYVNPRPLINTGTNEQRIAELVLSGPGGRILGEDLRWVLGANYRREAGNLAVDPLYAGEDFLGFGNTGGFVGGEPSGAADRVSGAYEARELFAEMQASLLHDQPLARDLTLKVGARWSDYSSFDANLSWQAGLRWQPAAALTLRANYAEVFRAPDIVELYDPRVRFEEYWDFDPCGNDPTPTQQANCAANGVPGGAYVQGGESFAAPTGGNP